MLRRRGMGCYSHRAHRQAAPRAFNSMLVSLSRGCSAMPGSVRRHPEIQRLFSRKDLGPAKGSRKLQSARRKIPQARVSASVGSSPQTVYVHAEICKFSIIKQDYKEVYKYPHSFIYLFIFICLFISSNFGTAEVRCKKPDFKRKINR